MKHWQTVKLSAATTKVGSGATPQGGSNAYKDAGTPLIRSQNVRFEGFDPKGLAYLDDEQADELKNVEVRANDVLLNITGASIGRVTLAPLELDGARVNQHVCIIRPKPGLDAEFLSRYFASPSKQRYIMSNQSGATRQALTKAKILDYDIPLPPLNEQRRIVAKIEDLTARSQAAKQALDAIPPLLERFRQSVLAAAFRGDLTKQWRQQNPNVEPASELLKRIRQERRHRWEQDYLAQQKAKSKTPKDDKWKEKYREPEPVGTEGLPDLPEGWCWAGLEELKDFSDNAMTDGPFGSKLKSAHYTTSGVRVIRLGNIKVGKFDDSQKSYVSENHFESLRKHEAFSGDLVIAALAEPVGRACLVPATVGRAMVKADCIRFKPHPSVSVRCLMHYLNSPTSTRLTENLSHGLGRLRINMADLRTLPVALPPASEQAMIVEQFEECLRGLETTHLAFTTNSTLLERLNQSILAKAFRGELVPQDPNDEPASALLERIRAEKATNDPKGVGRKRSKS